MSSFEENRRRPLWIFIVLLLIAGGGYTFYKKGSAEDSQDAGQHMQRPPAVVSVHEVEVVDAPLVFEYSGRTNGSREVEIRARVSGILLKRAYVEGQAVKQGDVLFEIDPAPFKVALDQAKARFAQANNDWSRAQKLFAVQALSARERDQARANYAQTKAEVENAQINLGYTTVTAPISGVTSQESLSEGSLVTADASLLTRLSQLDPIYVHFSVPDSEMLNQRHLVSTGEYLLPEDGILRAEIHLGNGSIYAHEGEINFTDSIIDPQTGSVNSRAVVPNPNNVLMPGQFVRVVVKGLSKRDALIVPDKAIMQGPQGPFVYIVNDQGHAELRPVILGMVNDNMRLIEKGLSHGDKVITEGMIKVVPNSPVQLAGAAQNAQQDAAHQEPAQEAAAEQHDMSADEQYTGETQQLEAIDGMSSDADAGDVDTSEADADANVSADENGETKSENQYVFGLGIEATETEDDLPPEVNTLPEVQPEVQKEQ